VQAYDVVYAGGGGINALLKITPADLIHHTRAEVASMLADDAPAPPAAPSEG
jgi:prolyl-tRNA editing enzyme YbaK/EbsC (Cys-tRNA(Pro) deacylase)